MPPGHHPQAAMNQAAMAQHHPPGQPLTSELAKRRSRKPTDKTLPDGVEDCIADAEVAQRYKELRDFERRLDATMTRKRLDIVEAVGRTAKVGNSLRPVHLMCPSCAFSRLSLLYQTAIQDPAHLD